MDAIEPLLQAVGEDDGEAVRELVREDPGLLQTAKGLERDGPSPILEALYLGASEALEALLEIAPTLGVHEAAALGDAERLRELLEVEPARLSSLSDDGWTPLHLACFFDRPEAVRLLLDRGASVEVTSHNAMANRPLHAALAGGAGREVVEAMLDSGAEVGAQAGGGYTPLHLAASRGSAELVELLLDRGAVPSSRADDGSTPPEIAAERGHPEVAERLRQVDGVDR